MGVPQKKLATPVYVPISRYSNRCADSACLTGKATFWAPSEEISAFSKWLLCFRPSSLVNNPHSLRTSTTCKHLTCEGRPGDKVIYNLTGSHPQGNAGPVQSHRFTGTWKCQHCLGGAGAGSSGSFFPKCGEWAWGSNLRVFCETLIPRSF